jgi:K+-transporting ATPase ATPase C chain
MNSIVVSLRLVAFTLLINVAGYTALMLGFARIVSPDTAAGSLIMNGNGTVVGSRLIAQKFSQSHYFWPRPSAVDYNAAGAGGSNKSPTSPDLTARAASTIGPYGATPEKPLPADLAAASGGGLDPHITLIAALYQADRVAKARALPREQVEALVRDHAFAPGGILTPDRLVNVLELNLALDGR